MNTRYAKPEIVVWDVTYACPLRCVHCYSESGRRAARQLPHDDMLRVADAIASLRPAAVALAGGEPLLVPGLAEVAARFSRAGVMVSCYTSGWRLTPADLDRLTGTVDVLHVSVDGATAEVNDRIRGRAGAFDHALDALELLDRRAAGAAADGRRALTFCVDYVVVRSNVDQMEEFCRTVMPRFPRTHSVSFGAAVPSGLASRAGFADHELLDDARLDRLADPGYGRYLQSLLPAPQRVFLTDNRLLQVHPDLVAEGRALAEMQVEPDGGVRGIPIYEGTVGNLLTEPADELWRRAVRRWSDPVVMTELAPARTMRDWAAAVRRLDLHFGTDTDRARIRRRPAYQL